MQILILRSKHNEMSIESSDLEGFELQGLLEVSVDLLVLLINGFEDAEKDVVVINQLLENGNHHLAQVQKHPDEGIQRAFLVDYVDELLRGHLLFLLVWIFLNHPLSPSIQQGKQEFLHFLLVFPDLFVQEKNDPHVVQQVKVEVDEVVLEVHFERVGLYFLLDQVKHEQTDSLLFLAVLFLVLFD